MTPAVQRQIVAKYESVLPLVLPATIPKEKGCFYHALATLIAVKSFGWTALIQAGSASFLAVPDELDDGESPTHYSYVYEGWTESPNMLPEIHCWVVVKWMLEFYIIDPTTRYLPLLSKKAGIEWKTPSPPECLFAPVKCLPKGWLYDADPEATIRVVNIIRSM